MSGNFNDDNKFSDDCIDSGCLRNHIIKSELFGEGYDYVNTSGTKLDTDHNIDGYINNVPVQMHMQRFENIKGSIKRYHAFTKYKRNKTNAKTELSKIINNKENNRVYPKYIIWSIIEPDKDILHKIEIIDVNDMLINLNKNMEEYKKKNNLDEIDKKFYKDSKHYSTFYNKDDGTEPLFLKTETPEYEFTYDPMKNDFLLIDD
tara:strand:- start:1848 stop:2459 length:612 start_codon:yes stop_codon:yes gene_type:complete